MESIQTLVETVKGIQWRDVLDILVVTLLIYKLLPLIRTPHMMRLTRTVVLVVLVTWITGEAKLHTLNFILSQVLAVGLLAFVVLFQPELRQMINHLGSVQLTRLFGSGRPAQEMETVITQTVMACETMSREKVGALIVFEREHKLDEYFKTGTVIDGQVSEQLLRNIFFPKAALHDGAAIIRSGRVATAGCVLPLTSNTRLSPDLGTRHRAGVGVSEVSDAIVVVISEETGTISVAEGGMLKRHLAPQTLEKLLRSKLIPTADNPDRRTRSGIFGKHKEAADSEEK